MKIILTSLILTLSFLGQAQAVAACHGNLEARFTANYNNVDLSYAEAGNIEHTTFNLKDFSVFQPNLICPLTLQQALTAQIYVLGLLQAHSGAAVSGLLIYNPKFNQFSIQAVPSSRLTDAAYRCVADKMQAMNSDLFYNLDSFQIDSMLEIPEMTGHNEAVAAAKFCGT